MHGARGPADPAGGCTETEVAVLALEQCHQYLKVSFAVPQCWRLPREFAVDLCCCCERKCPEQSPQWGWELKPLWEEGRTDVCVVILWVGP